MHWDLLLTMGFLQGLSVYDWAILYKALNLHDVLYHPYLFTWPTGNLCMITGGRNLGRVGTIVSRERHAGSFDIVHVKDAVGHTFATR